jgi:hypothetical protein
VLWIVVTKPGMGRAGFQLSVRADEAAGKDKQEGTLAPLDDRTQFAAKNFGPIQYLEHTGKGTTLTGPDMARWSFRWQAPQTHGPVVFHIAANAANDDNSELGDFIYTKAFHVIPAP